jgi:hypothetical protein
VPIPAVLKPTQLSRQRVDQLIEIEQIFDLGSGQQQHRSHLDAAAASGAPSA